MERQFNACQSPCSMYLSIFNSFRVIRCLSQCVSPKIAIFTTLLFPLGTPLGQSRKTLHKWRQFLNSVLAKRLAACTHLSSTVSQFNQWINQHLLTSRSTIIASMNKNIKWYQTGWLQKGKSLLNIANQFTENVFTK